MRDIRKHEPVPEEMMRRVSSKRTICQVLRRIYWSTNDSNIRLLCREATSMAKAMTVALVEAKGEEFAKDLWDKDPEFRRFLRWKNRHG